MSLSLSHLLLIAAGGALGAVLRFVSSQAIHSLAGRGFPYGTLGVNVIGSLLMGLLYVYLVERSGLSEQWRAFLLIGLLGAFTTFSTFSIETFDLIENKEHLKAMMNVLLSVVLCIAGCWAGIILGRSI